jgi:hypothetical protein
MGDSYVELMWRVLKDETWDGGTITQLKAAFLDLDAAKEYAKAIGGKVIVLIHKEVA